MQILRIYIEKKLNKKKANYSIESDYKSISKNRNFPSLHQAELLTAEHIDYVVTAEKKLEHLSTAEDKLESLLKL